MKNICNYNGKTLPKIFFQGRRHMQYWDVTLKLHTRNKLLNKVSKRGFCKGEETVGTPKNSTWRTNGLKVFWNFSHRFLLLAR